MNLLDLLPETFQNSPEAAELQHTLDGPVETLWNLRDELMEQLHIRTATWGMELWEKAYGISPDKSRSFDSRRSQVLAKLRGVGVTTKAMVENVARSYSSGNVDIREYPREYRFEVQFQESVETPPNLDGFRKVLDELKPAHLTYGVSLESVYPEIRLSCVGAMSPGWTSTLLPEWEMQYDYRAVQNIAGRTETIIETVLPPFKEESM